MNAADIRDQMVEAMQPGRDLDFPAIVNEITAAYTVAATVEERTTLLDLFKTLMDSVESQIEPDLLDRFKEVRDQDYSQLLLRECADARQAVSPQRLDLVTAREIAAGRMSRDHGLRKLADFGMTAVATAETPTVAAGWRRVFGLGRKAKKR